MDSIEKVLGYTRQILPELGWSVKEFTAAKFLPPSGRGRSNESYGCYTRPKAGFKGVWVGLVNHRKAESGVYASLEILPSKPTMKALRNGYRESPFGPHPMMKKIISERELIRYQKKHGERRTLQRLKALLKKTYPFNL